MKTLDPKPFIKQNKMKQNREQQEYKYKNGYYIYEIKNSKTSKPHVLILKFTDELDLRRGENRIAKIELLYQT